MVLIDDVVSDICRQGSFCKITAKEFAANQENRNLSSQHLLVIMAHCVWCDSKSAIMSRVSLCFNYYLSSLNTSGPVPPPPSLEDATVTDSDATDSADSTASAAGKPDGVAVVALLLVLYALLILLGLFSNLMVAVSLVKATRIRQ
uniref:G_PROTEIN_RECEP_F1_2 domain-containing protein n=1 Tax=Macrostomum lignano TaxID=282301 RepID=A0A1I8HVY5_9PLAT